MQAEQCNRFRRNHFPFPARKDRRKEEGQYSYPFSRSIFESNWKFITSRPPFWPSEAVGLIAKEPFAELRHEQL